MNRNGNFTGEWLILEEYERLKSIDPNNPILNYGAIMKKDIFNLMLVFMNTEKSNIENNQLQMI